MPSLALAMQSPMASTPSASLLFGSSPDLQDSSADDSEEATVGMASRLAAAIGVPVAISLSLQGAGAAAASAASGGMDGGSLPPAPSDGGPELQVFVERTILKELRTCQKLGMLAKPIPVQ
jgi:hypothetical protein